MEQHPVRRPLPAHPVWQFAEQLSDLDSTNHLIAYVESLSSSVASQWVELAEALSVSGEGTALLRAVTEGPPSSWPEGAHDAFKVFIVFEIMADRGLLPHKYCDCHKAFNVPASRPPAVRSSEVRSALPETLRWIADYVVMYGRPRFDDEMDEYVWALPEDERVALTAIRARLSDEVDQHLLNEWLVQNSATSVGEWVWYFLLLLDYFEEPPSLGE